MSIEVTYTENISKMPQQLTLELTGAFEDVVLDIKRVSSQASPHKSGNLEKNRHTYTKGFGGLTGEIIFEGTNGNFDYAEWTHDSNYNLGEKSLRKRAGQSKFISGSVPVGAGYLSNTLEQGEQGYVEHLQKALGIALK